MSKTAITRLFLGAILAVVAGIFVVLAGTVAALSNGAITFGGPDVVTVTDAFAVTLFWFVIAALLFLAGGVAAVVSWIGALFNTVQLEDKTWFVVLLVLGLFSFGWLAMAAYVLAGPDSAKEGAPYAGGATVPSR
ncbi:MAG TPA: hypothetical protein VJ839_06275 [Candidatus Limnocylindria bacterium]|nr:hypothetical protein [Candidatus Limnocylindria bacterium]